MAGALGGFRVYRGQDTPSPAQLGLQLLPKLLKALSKSFGSTSSQPIRLFWQRQ